MKPCWKCKQVLLAPKQVCPACGQKQMTVLSAALALVGSLGLIVLIAVGIGSASSDSGDGGAPSASQQDTNQYAVDMCDGRDADGTYYVDPTCYRNYGGQ